MINLKRWRVALLHSAMSSGESRDRDKKTSRSMTGRSIEMSWGRDMTAMARTWWRTKYQVPLLVCLYISTASSSGAADIYADLTGNVNGNVTVSAGIRYWD